MARRTREPVNSWPSWRYGPYGEAQIFNTESEVPHGWTKKPGEIYVPPENHSLDRDDLVRQLNELGITINPIWGKAHMKKVINDFSPTR